MDANSPGEDVFKITLTPDTSEIDKELKSLRESLRKPLDANIDKLYQLDLLKGLQTQREELSRLRVLMNPDILRERVKLQKEELQLKERLIELEHKEMMEQNRPGFFQSLFQNPNNSFTALQKSFSRFFQGIREEFRKGGFGGLMDKAFLTLGGQGGMDKTSLLLAGILGGQGGRGVLGQIGGMVGQSFGGPVGAIAGETLAGLIPKIVNAPAQALIGTIGKVAGALSSLQSELGPVDMAFGVISGGAKAFSSVVKSIPVVGEVLGPVAETLSAGVEFVHSIVQSLTRMSALSSPGLYRQLQMAIEDTQATLGRSFTPFVEILRDFSRLVGDLFANILPNAQEVRQALAPFLEEWKRFQTEMREVMRDIGPLIREFLIANLRLLAIALSAAARGVEYLVKAMKPFLAVLSGMTGISLPQGENEFRSSVGMTARPASITGAMEYQRQLQVSAFSATSSMASVPNNVASINQNSRGLLDFFIGGRFASSLAQALSRSQGRNPNKAGDALKDFFQRK